MPYLGTSQRPKPSASPPASLMEKGLQALRAVADRDHQAPECRLGGTQSVLRESAHAAGWFYRRLVRARGAWEATRFSTWRKASGWPAQGAPN